MPDSEKFFLFFFLIKIKKNHTVNYLSKKKEQLCGAEAQKASCVEDVWDNSIAGLVLALEYCLPSARKALKLPLVGTLN